MVFLLKIYCQESSNEYLFRCSVWFQSTGLLIGKINRKNCLAIILAFRFKQAAHSSRKPATISQD